MPQLTSDVMTVGITNLPLTKPTYLYFISDMSDEGRIKMIYDTFNAFNIQFKREDNLYNQTCIMTSMFEIHPSVLKNIWRNFKTMKPKIKTSWRYLFWEIDSQDADKVNEVLAVYKVLNLPVYVHESMRGFHFLSVKPLEETLWTYAVNLLRPTNLNYPPLTLRIKPNKYVEEESVFKNGYIIGKDHYDTEQLKIYIEQFNLVELQQRYVIVFYPFPKQEQLDSMTLEERAKFQLKQVEDSQ